MQSKKNQSNTDLNNRKNLRLIFRIFSGLILLSLILLFTYCNRAEASISMATATSMAKETPFVLLEGEPWQAESDAEYVKLHLYPDEILMLSRVEIQSCNDEFKSEANLYINFDENVYQLKPEKRMMQKKFPQVLSVRSITVNFLKNRPVCVNEFRLFNEEGKRVYIRTPRIIKGDVSATSTLEPVSSYDVMNLFDSRYEYAWSSNGYPDGVELSFSFKDEQTIKKLKIWNGYQRSHVHCYSNSRVKTLEFSGDDGYSAKVELQDIMGPQIIELPREYEGHNLKMKVAAVYPGKKYKDIVISELRFSDGDDWFLVSPMKRISEIANSNRFAFKESGVINALNHSLQGNVESLTNAQGELEDETEDGKSRSGEWTLRLRSDGSFFIEGFTDTEDIYEGKKSFESYFGLGNYEIRKASASGLRMRIFGFVRSYAEVQQMEDFGGDCNGCGRDCNLISDPSGKQEKIFSEELLVSAKDDSFIVRNVSPKKKLSFSALKLKVE